MLGTSNLPSFFQNVPNSNSNLLDELIELDADQLNDSDNKSDEDFLDDETFGMDFSEFSSNKNLPDFFQNNNSNNFSESLEIPGKIS